MFIIVSLFTFNKKIALYLVNTGKIQAFVNSERFQSTLRYKLLSRPLIIDSQLIICEYYIWEYDVILEVSITRLIQAFVNETSLNTHCGVRSLLAGLFPEEFWFDSEIHHLPCPALQ